jgi:hypothetical protein
MFLITWLYYLVGFPWMITCCTCNYSPLPTVLCAKVTAQPQKQLYLHTANEIDWTIKGSYLSWTFGWSRAPIAGPKWDVRPVSRGCVNLYWCAKGTNIEFFFLFTPSY